MPNLIGSQANADSAPFPRNRDCYVFFKGNTYPVSIAPEMLQRGWQGGQAVMWKDTDQDDFMVTYSTGLYGGFLLWGSNEPSDQYTSMTGNQLEYGFGILCAGRWLMTTRTAEIYTYASRMSGGPLVPINWVVGARALFSLRGYWTLEDEWTLSGDPRAPNNYYIAYVMQAPTAANNYYVTLQTSI